MKQFHIEIRQVQKGHLVFVTDGNGDPIRHPIKMSDFEERPRFYQSKRIPERIEFSKGYTTDKATIPKENHNGYTLLVDLLRLIPNYSDKNNFRKKRQLMKKSKRGYRGRQY